MEVVKGVVNMSLGYEGARGCSPPKLGRNPLHSGKFSERTIENLGNFSAYSPALFDISGRKFTAPLNLTPMLVDTYFLQRSSSSYISKWYP